MFVAGLSNEEFSSRLLSLAYPFSDSASGTSIEIFHGAHGKLETKSPVRTFVAYQIQGEPYLLAAYTCTPLVKFPVSAMKSGAHLKGTTVAELGNRNKPLDMIVYKKDGKDYLLMANSSRGVMKIPTEPADKAEAITKPVKTEKQGMGYETIAALKGVTQLDVLDKDHALILVQAPGGAMTLENHRPAVITSCLILLLMIASPEDPPSAKPSIRLQTDAKPQAVEVVGIDPANLQKLADADWTLAQWSELFPVSAISGDRQTPKLTQLPGSLSCGRENPPVRAEIPVRPRCPPTPPDSVRLDYRSRRRPRSRSTSAHSAPDRNLIVLARWCGWTPRASARP